MGGCRQHGDCKKCVVDAAEYERDLSFNLHAKRSIEHIVILIGRVDKPRPGQWLFDYIPRSLAILWTGSRARGGRQRFIRRVLRRVMRCSFIAQSNFFPSSSVSLSPCLSLFLTLFSAFRLSSDRYTPDANASAGDRARVRKRV